MSVKTTQILNAFKATEAVWKKRIAASSISDHPVAKGNIAEDAWRALLKAYLPTRYKVSPGFVVSCKGRYSHQIDCIIYDNTFTPTFFGESGVCYIPAEAVYAVFEIKQEMNKENILYSSNKVESVRSLYRTSAPYVGDGKEKEPKPLVHIIGGLFAHRMNSGWSTQISTLNRLQPPANGGYRCLDSVITAEKGSADYFQGYPVSKPNLYPSEEGGLMMGILRLVQALQAQGTVPAIDWKEWLSKVRV